MICRVRFLEPEPEAGSATPQAVPAVPASAVVTEGNSTAIFLVRDGRAVRVSVRIGSASGGRVPVESGLRPGDRIIVAPPPGLADGERVTENRK
jgi:hypothetical protein